MPIVQNLSYKIPHGRTDINYPISTHAAVQLQYLYLLFSRILTEIESSREKKNPPEISLNCWAVKLGGVDDVK